MFWLSPVITAEVFIEASCREIEHGVRIQLGLQFATTPPMPAEATADRRGRCPAPGYWDEQSHSCRIAPCAGIPGGCRNDNHALLKVGKVPR